MSLVSERNELRKIIRELTNDLHLVEQVVAEQLSPYKVGDIIEIASVEFMVINVQRWPSMDYRTIIQPLVNNEVVGKKRILEEVNYHEYCT